jgi:hypothetical protein
MGLRQASAGARGGDGPGGAARVQLSWGLWRNCRFARDAMHSRPLPRFDVCALRRGASAAGRVRVGGEEAISGAADGSPRGKYDKIPNLQWLASRCYVAAELLPQWLFDDKESDARCH